MNAANRIWLAGTLERIRATSLRWLPFVALIAIGLFAVRCDGIQEGERRIRTAVVDSTRRAAAARDKVLQDSIVALGVVLVKRAAEATRQRTAYHAAADRVHVVSDTVLRVDSILVHVPMPVVQVIARCDSVVRADSLVIHAQVVQLGAMTDDRNVWRTRALFDEAHQERVPRFGIKTGLAIGAGGLALLLHLLHR